MTEETGAGEDKGTVNDRTRRRRRKAGGGSDRSGSSRSASLPLFFSVEA